VLRVLSELKYAASTRGSVDKCHRRMLVVSGFDAVNESVLWHVIFDTCGTGEFLTVQKLVKK
jgi:hypothetical protein